MKRTIVVLATMGLFTVAANAQQDAATPPPPKGGHEMMSKEDRAKKKAEREAMLTKSLKDIGANDEQIAKVKDVMEDSHKKHEELKKDASVADDEKKVKGKEIMEAQKAKIREILGDEKAKKFAESQRAMMKRDMPMPPPPAAPAQ